MLYCHSFTKFKDVAFGDFNAIGNLTNATMPTQWFSNLNGGEDVEYLAFFFVGHKYLIYSSCIEGAIVVQPVTKVIFDMVVNKVKEKCEGSIQGLILVLEMRFPRQEIMTALSVIGLLIQQLWKRFFFLTLAHCKRLFVTFVRLVDWTKMFFHCFQLTCLIYSLVISR